HRIVNRRTNMPYFGYRLFLNDENVATFERWDNNTLLGAASGGSVIAPGLFSHLVATYDGTTLSLYVNGTLAKSTSAPRAMSSTPTPFIFGTLSISRGEYFAGTLDELAVYDKALKADRVMAHFRTGRGL